MLRPAFYAFLALVLGVGCNSPKHVTSKPKTTKPKTTKAKTWYGRPGVTTWNSDHTIKTTYVPSGHMGHIRIYEEVVHRPDGSVYSTLLMKPTPLSPKDLLEGVLGGHSRDGYYPEYKIYNPRGRVIKSRQFVPEPWLDLKNLEPEIRKEARKSVGDIFPTDLTKVRLLRVHNKTIPSPSPIVWLTRASKVELKDCKISDFKSLGKELSGLPALKFCFLENCQIRDPAPLAGLMRVWFLSLKDNQITQLDFVEKFDQLETLFLNGNQISDLTPLAKVTRLESLRLSHNQITDLAPLMGLTRLKSLDLRGNPNLTQAGVDKLQKALPKCEIRDDLRPASVKIELEIEISIRQSINKPTGKLTQVDRESLKELSLSQYGITDLKPLAGLTGLEWLSLSHNQITDLKPLAGLPRLRMLYLSDNQITDLKPLAGLTRLTKLQLRSNQVTDLTPLAGLTKLDHLYIFNNPNLTRAEVDKLKLALPKCRIDHSARK